MAAMQSVFGSGTPCSGTKGLTGHTLGAAGGIEAVIAWLSLREGLLPGTCGLRETDPAFDAEVLKTCRADAAPRRVMSNNFGFGGNNTTLLFGWAP
ncbi:MAG TPA: beta-ketoacyl-[acyl-carrier-protein] synthase II, partial [Gammaproteobacteria bacterium]|nr:beta-ketoacyl-[acyl-carrier-protein] synthase II [Gammaproteobacteria bacterium]